ncbi:DUF1648 domain-containing protein [Streptomyces sp. NBC_01363]|uniref:DUF1648 domain-containing protein n=1 Tax=Streptomyces sp. NBC_01363 TaxID=2903840 RepID=UPI002259BF6B|nr:DUF5808 domain-containing protein [Streptomyces sp. NBC_01363]MCX4735541.1 DUF5808 domain-containing protein [Streptomyces sp. NBC_01363]
MNTLLVDAALNFGLLAVLSAVLYAAPSPLLNPSAVPFGVRVPPDKTRAAVVEEQHSRYRGAMLVAAAVVTVLASALGAALGTLTAGAAGSLLLCALAAALWVRAHRGIARAKAEGGWYGQARQGSVADTSLRTDPVRFPWGWTVPGLVVIAVSFAAGVVVYPGLPDRIALPERSSGGTVYHMYTTSVWTAFSLVLGQVLLTLTMAVVVAGLLRARADLDVARPVADAARYRRYLTVTARSMMGITALVNLMLLGLSALMWSDTRSMVVSLAVTGVPFVAVLAVVARFVLRVGPSGSRLPEGTGEESTGLVARDDDRFWRGAGTIYVNADDPAVLVPKRVGIGWTVNFGNPRSLVVAALVLAVAVGATVVQAVR